MNKPKIKKDSLKQKLESDQKTHHQRDKDKLEMVHQSLTSIGHPIAKSITKKVTKMFLSHNRLSSLEGIEAFKKLRSLSLCFNQIEDTKELMRIENKHLLEHLNIEYNPLTKNPNYRRLMLILFPNLQRLDSLKITTMLRMCHEGIFVKISKVLIPFLVILEHDKEILKKLIKLEQRFDKAEDHCVNTNLKISFNHFDEESDFSRPFIDLDEILRRFFGIKRFCESLKRVNFDFFETNEETEYCCSLFGSLLDFFNSYCDYFKEIKFMNLTKLEFFYEDLFRDIMLNYNMEGDASLMHYLKSTLLNGLNNEQRDIFVWKFNRESHFAFDCMAQEFSKLWKTDCSLDNENYSVLGMDESLDSLKNDWIFCTRRTPKIHFPVFSYNNAYLKRLFWGIYEKIKGFTETLERYLQNSYSPIKANEAEMLQKVREEVLRKTQEMKDKFRNVEEGAAVSENPTTQMSDQNLVKMDIPEQADIDEEKVEEVESEVVEEGLSGLHKLSSHFNSPENEKAEFFYSDLNSNENTGFKIGRVSGSDYTLMEDPKFDGARTETERLIKKNLVSTNFFQEARRFRGPQGSGGLELSGSGFKGFKGGPGDPRIRSEGGMNDVIFVKDFSNFHENIRRYATPDKQENDPRGSNDRENSLNRSRESREGLSDLPIAETPLEENPRPRKSRMEQPKKKEKKENHSSPISLPNPHSPPIQIAEEETSTLKYSNNSIEKDKQGPTPAPFQPVRGQTRPNIGFLELSEFSEVAKFLKLKRLRKGFNNIFAFSNHKSIMMQRLGLFTSKIEKAIKLRFILCAKSYANIGTNSSYLLVKKSSQREQGLDSDQKVGFGSSISLGGTNLEASGDSFKSSAHPVYKINLLSKAFFGLGSCLARRNWLIWRLCTRLDKNYKGDLSVTFLRLVENKERFELMEAKRRDKLIAGRMVFNPLYHSPAKNGRSKGKYKEMLEKFSFKKVGGSPRSEADQDCSFGKDELDDSGQVILRGFNESWRGRDRSSADFGVKREIEAELDSQRVRRDRDRTREREMEIEDPDRYDLRAGENLRGSVNWTESSLNKSYFERKTASPEISTNKRTEKKQSSALKQAGQGGKGYKKRSKKVNFSFENEGERGHHKTEEQPKRGRDYHRHYATNDQRRDQKSKKKEGHLSRMERGARSFHHSNQLQDVDDSVEDPNEDTYFRFTPVDKKASHQEMSQRERSELENRLNLELLYSVEDEPQVIRQVKKSENRAENGDDLEQRFKNKNSMSYYYEQSGPHDMDNILVEDHNEKDELLISNKDLTEALKKRLKKCNDLLKIDNPLKQSPRVRKKKVKRSHQKRKRGRSKTPERADQSPSKPRNQYPRSRSKSKKRPKKRRKPNGSKSRDGRSRSRTPKSIKK